MNNSDSKQYTAAMRFWDAFRACVEENRIDHSRSAYYVKWAQAFYRFFSGKGLRERTKQDIETFLADIGKQPGSAGWQAKQAEYALKILYEIFLPDYIPQNKVDQTQEIEKEREDKNISLKAGVFRDRVVPGEKDRGTFASLGRRT